MMTVSALAEQTNVTREAIRHYTRIGLLKPSRDPANHYRHYTQDDVQRVHFIRSAQMLGFSLSDIQNLFDQAASGKSPCPETRKAVLEKLKENQAEIERRQQLHIQLQAALNQWADMPDGTPSRSSICPLIESLSH